jgi:hypothetical protein
MDEPTRRSDTFKTIAGLVLIAAIIIATFVYGNAQRKVQMEADRAAGITESSSCATYADRPINLVPVRCLRYFMGAPVSPDNK